MGRKSRSKRKKEKVQTALPAGEAVQGKAVETAPSDHAVVPASTAERKEPSSSRVEVPREQIPEPLPEPFPEERQIKEIETGSLSVPLAVESTTREPRRDMHAQNSREPATSEPPRQIEGTLPAETPQAASPSTPQPKPQLPTSSLPSAGEHSAAKKCGGFILRQLRAFYARLPSRRETWRAAKDLCFGGEPEKCLSPLGPARPVMRFLAALYDLALLILVNTLVFGAAGYSALKRFMAPLVENDPNAFIPAEAKNYLMGALGISLVFTWLYLTLLEALPGRATLGKKLCSIKTADLNGNRISIFRANLRFFAKLGSLATLGFGYIIAVTRKDHRAIHDLMAKTQVIKEVPDA